MNRLHPVLHQTLRIAFSFDLLQRLPAAGLEIAVVRVFDLDYNAGFLFPELRLDIAVSVPGLRIGGDVPVLPVAQQPQQDPVIEIFLPRSARTGITDTDRPAQVSCELSFNGSGVSFPERLAESVQRGRILFCLLLKPGQDLFGKDLPDPRFGMASR